ncbi:unnamed protein product [Polarella glacialis]|uniref:U1-type domain-containing protein n=1 Tax=Polarella glacialis TaxID=89957 RepID=A0A813FLR9_POLGL|nr:unnamed protein product [Polarella glacialis]
MPAKVKVLRPEDVTQEMFAKVSMESKGVLSPWVTSLEARNSGDEPGASEDLRLALSCTDVKLREVGDDGTLCLGSSPRAIELGAALDSVFPEGAESIESSDDGGSSYLEEDGDGSKKAQARVAALAKEQPECEGAIYCRHCEMWLNGPTQWADHEIGKKHRKAVRRTQAHSLCNMKAYKWSDWSSVDCLSCLIGSLKQTRQLAKVLTNLDRRVQKQLGADGEEKEIKAVPEGFGKKMKSIAIFRSRQAEGDEKSEAGGQGDERPQASESLPFQGRTRGNLAGFRKSGGQVPPPPPPPEGMRDEHGNWRSEGDQLRWRAEYSQGSHQGQWPAAAQPVWGCNYNPETGQWAYGMMIPAGNLPPPPVFQDQWYGYSQEQQHQ